MSFRAVLLTVLLAGLAGGACAQVREAPNEVSPVTVMPPTLPPKLVASYPAEGETIAPGVLIVKLTFDQVMNPRLWSYGVAPDAERPECVKTPRLLKDGKTFVLLCRVLSDRTYKIALNAQWPDGFANEADNAAETRTLSFQVVRGEPVTSLGRAMKAAGLKDDEEPIEEAPEPPAAAKP
ncbi:MAG: hypothetical protein KKC14_07015 [Alphaproteobacteria bacterium]|nr:hypothetical protein [Alphaproteobacteria bacterium]